MMKTKTIRKARSMPDVAAIPVPVPPVPEIKLPALPDPVNVPEPPAPFAYTDVKEVVRIPGGFQCSVKFACCDADIAFQASSDDVEAHGRAIYAECEAGQWGSVPDYFPSEAELLAAAQARISRELQRANVAVTKYQDFVDINHFTDTDLALLLAWKTYRAGLNRLSALSNFPHPIIWPVAPDATALSFTQQSTNGVKHGN